QRRRATGRTGALIFTMNRSCMAPGSRCGRAFFDLFSNKTRARRSYPSFWGEHRGRRSVNKDTGGPGLFRFATQCNFEEWRRQPARLWRGLAANCGCDGVKPRGGHAALPGLDCLTPILWQKIANGVTEVEGNGGGFYGTPCQPGAIIKNDVEFILFLRKGGE